jgi:threonine synthase
MTTCTDANVHNLAIEGTFDDCQVSIEYMDLGERKTGLQANDVTGYRQSHVW